MSSKSNQNSFRLCEWIELPGVVAGAAIDAEDCDLISIESGGVGVLDLCAVDCTLGVNGSFIDIAVCGVEGEGGVVTRGDSMKRIMEKL